MRRVFFHGLEQLRTSAEFRAMEATVAERYENVVVVVAKDVVPFKTFSDVNGAEVTGAAGNTRYIYIDTSTTSVKMQDGTLVSMSVEQIFAHAMAHSASNLPPDNPFGLNRTASSELEAIRRTNTVTQEAQLTGPRDTTGVQFRTNGTAGVPELKFSDGNSTIDIPEILPPHPSAAEVARGKPVNRIEQDYDENEETEKVTIYDEDGSKAVTDIDQKGEQSWSQKTTQFDAEDSIQSVDIFYDNGSRTAQGFDEAGFVAWEFQRDANGTSVLQDANGTAINFDDAPDAEFSQTSEGPQVAIGPAGAEAIAGLELSNGSLSVNLNEGTSFTTPDGSQVSVGADGSVLDRHDRCPAPNTIGAWARMAIPAPDPPRPSMTSIPIRWSSRPAGSRPRRRRHRAYSCPRSDAHFDYGGTGFSVRTGWAASSEGILSATSMTTPTP